MYNHNKNCGCGCQSIVNDCKISTTTSNCCTPTCPPPVVACPPVACPPGGNPPTITIENLLELIETKCSKEVCGILAYEIALLYALLDIDRPKPPGPVDPIPPVVPLKKFQLIKNMVETLTGDLTGKYPSAELLKKS